MRDSQRSKVYAWERAAIPGWQEGQWRGEGAHRHIASDGIEHTFYRWQRCRIDAELPLADCAALVAKVWAGYRPGAAPPRVTPGHMARAATGDRSRVNLPRWARQSVVVIHETAHSLLPLVRWEAGAVCLAAHGPEFVRLFIELLVRYHRPCRGQRATLVRSAKAAKIKVGRLADCPKPIRPAR